MVMQIKLIVVVVVVVVVGSFLAWGDFHARSCFARFTIPEDKWGTTRSLDINAMPNFKPGINLIKLLQV